MAFACTIPSQTLRVQASLSVACLTDSRAQCGHLPAGILHCPARAPGLSPRFGAHCLRSQRLGHLHISRSARRQKRAVQVHATLTPPPLHSPFTVVLIVPTGVAAAIGGYAGDALPVARAFSEVADIVISHPNVLNGAMLYWPMDNVLYVEGYGLDKFAAGEWGLRPVRYNKVGLILDAAIEEELMTRHLQVADAARATLGIHMTGYAVTDRPLDVKKWVDATTGQSTGRITESESLLRAAETLIHPPMREDGTVTEGCDALAIVARFPDDGLEELEQYRHGQGVDVLAGVEAVISHMVVQHFGLPAAHAPALAPLPLLPSLSPRSAAEEIGHTFLPCVLAGLSRAPQFVPLSPSMLQPLPAATSPFSSSGTSSSNSTATISSNSSSSSSITIPAPDSSATRIPSQSPQSHSFQSHDRSPTSQLYRGVRDIAAGPSASLWAADVDCVVLPVSAFGGDGVQALANRPGGAPLFIAVEENTTVLKDTPEACNVQAVRVKNYWEALGIVAAVKAGVNPLSLRRDGVAPLQEVPSHLPLVAIESA